MHVNFCRRGRGRRRSRSAAGSAASGYQYHWRNQGFRTFDDYLASLRSKRRNQVRRERRELAEQGVDDRDARRRRDPGGAAAARCTALPRDRRRQPVGPALPDASASSSSSSSASATGCASSLARRGGEVIAGTSTCRRATRSTAATGARFEDAALPALQRLLLRGDRALHRAGPRALRARRGRRVQAPARLRRDARRASMHWIGDVRLRAAVARLPRTGAGARRGRGRVARAAHGAAAGPGRRLVSRAERALPWALGALAVGVSARIPAGHRTGGRELPAARCQARARRRGHLPGLLRAAHAAGVPVLCRGPRHRRHDAARRPHRRRPRQRHRMRAPLRPRAPGRADPRRRWWPPRRS